MRDQWGMTNLLKVSLQATIYSLHGRGWSRRRIARELGINTRDRCESTRGVASTQKQNTKKISIRAQARSFQGWIGSPDAEGRLRWTTMIGDAKNCLCFFGTFQQHLNSRG